MSGVWSSGRWCFSKIFRDKGDTGQWGKEGEDLPRAAERRNAQTQMKAVQVLWERCVLLWGGSGRVNEH